MIERKPKPPLSLLTLFSDALRHGSLLGGVTEPPGYSISLVADTSLVLQPEEPFLPYPESLFFYVAFQFSLNKYFRDGANPTPKIKTTPD